MVFAWEKEGTVGKLSRVGNGNFVFVLGDHRVQVALHHLDPLVQLGLLISGGVGGNGSRFHEEIARVFNEELVRGP